jgi:hypothetical protein
MTVTLAPRDVGEPVGAKIGSHPDPIVVRATRGKAEGEKGTYPRRGYLLTMSFTASLTFSPACLTPLTVAQQPKQPAPQDG